MSPACHPLKLGWLVVGLAILGAGVARAHGPFDHSARLTLMGDELELGLTLGPELAQQALTHGGMAPEQVRELLASRGPSGHGNVSPEAAGALAVLSGSDGALVPTRVVVLTDGLEFLFVATFPRPSGGPLSFRARYLDAVPSAPRGSIELVDDASSRRLALELLNSSQKTAEFSLPESAAEAVSNAPPVIAVEQPAPVPVAMTNDVAPEVAVASNGGGSRAWWIGGVVVAVAGFLFWARSRRRASQL